jgi:glycerate dehydrogenase
MSEHIVVLDGYTLNPGDLDWGVLSALGEVEIHDRTQEDQVIQRCRAASCVLTNKIPFTREVIAALPLLKYIGVTATGYNIVDLNAATERGIIVTNIPVYGTDSVAQHVAALMLDFARGIGVHNAAVHNGEWTDSIDWCFSRQPMFELTGKTLGIVGIGRIGQAVARIAAAMGMKLIAHDLYFPTEDQLAGLEVRQVDMDTLFSEADVISLHCPLTAENERLVNAHRLSQMKRSALIINTSRGQLIDNHALADALHTGEIAGASLDVLDTEPPTADNPLLKAPNCTITPHIAWYAIEARARLLETAANNIAAYIAGEKQNQVN